MQLPGRDVIIGDDCRLLCPSLAAAPLHRMTFRNGWFLQDSEGIAIAPNVTGFLGDRLLFK